MDISIAGAAGVNHQQTDKAETQSSNTLSKKQKPHRAIWIAQWGAFVVIISGLRWSAGVFSASALCVITISNLAAKAAQTNTVLPAKQHICGDPRQMAFIKWLAVIASEVKLRQSRQPQLVAQGL